MIILGTEDQAFHSGTGLRFGDRLIHQQRDVP